MQIDNEDPIHMDYQLPIEAVEVMHDAYENTYMTGLSVNLTAGTHTIRMTYNPDCPKTFQFRNLYLVKAS